MARPSSDMDTVTTDVPTAEGPGNPEDNKISGESSSSSSNRDGSAGALSPVVAAATHGSSGGDPKESPLAYGISQTLLAMGMGGMYFLAFYGALLQNEGLMGDHGIVPAREWFGKAREQYGCRDATVVERLWNRNCARGFVDLPSVFWWIELTDDTMKTLLWTGTTLSVLLLCGSSNLGNNTAHNNSMALWLLLWILYFSVVTTASGTTFYNYGWESQVLETGFLCAFLCPHWVVPGPTVGTATTKPFREASSVVLWLFRWLCFRISIGAGMIKIRGDSCWTQKTCLLYHFETQPLPSPLSFAFHFLPEWALRRAVDLDLWVQVYTSWMVLLPALRVGPDNSNRLVRWSSRVSLGLVRLGGCLQIAFMANIALSGNMSMLNHLTILPALACLDDDCYPEWMRTLWGAKALEANQTPEKSAASSPDGSGSSKTGTTWKWGSPRVWIDRILLVGILYLSIPVVENLLELDGGRQQMNASFGSFRLVNTYGAFGSVGKRRYEPILSIAYETTVDDSSSAGRQDESALEQQPQRTLEWIEIEFPCKPGSLNRRPCFCAPYHYRLDWNIWFIGFKPHNYYLKSRETWLFSLVSKMLGGNTHPDDPKPWLDLLDDSSKQLLQQRGVPSYAKVDMYRYEMAAPLWELARRWFWMAKRGGSVPSVRWWSRKYSESLLPVVAFDHQQGRLVLAEDAS